MRICTAQHHSSMHATVSALQTYRGQSARNEQPVGILIQAWLHMKPRRQQRARHNTTSLLVLQQNGTHATYQGLVPGGARSTPLNAPR